MNNQATKSLPPDYRLHSRFDASNTSFLILLNILALVLLVVFAVVFIEITHILRPDAEISLDSLLDLFEITTFSGFIELMLALILAIILHEAVHGLFFWVYTGEVPIFGTNLITAYAGAPDWYLPPRQFFVVGLAPLVLITVGGFVVVVFVNGLLLVLVLVGMLANASGAVGDLWVCGQLLQMPAETLINDEGKRISFYVPEMFEQS